MLLKRVKWKLDEHYFSNAVENKSGDGWIFPEAMELGRLTTTTRVFRLGLFWVDSKQDVVLNGPEEAMCQSIHPFFVTQGRP